MLEVLQAVFKETFVTKSLAYENRSERLPTRAFLGAMLVFLYTFVLDDRILPWSDPVCPFMFQVISLSGIVFLGLLWQVATHHPELIASNWLNGCAIACSLTGAFIAFESYPAAPSLYYLGSVLIDLGFEWALVVTCLSLGTLGVKPVCLLAGVAAMGAYGLSLAVGLAPVQWAFWIYASLGPIAVGLGAPAAAAATKAMAAAEPLAEVSVTRPQVMPSITNLLFISLVVLMAAFGYSLGFTAHAEGPLSLVVLAGFAVVWRLCTRRSPNLDLVYKCAGIIVLFGLFVSVPGINEFDGLQAAALKAGSFLVYYLEIALFAGIASKSSSGGLALVSLGNACSLLGILIGQELHQAVSYLAGVNASLSYLLTVVVGCAFVAFIILAQQGFSMMRAIADIEDALEVLPASAKKPTIDLDERCGLLASACGLTRREEEVLRLLVRGYSGARMEQELVISKNTVKTHVRHVYAKLNCHSQQELIAKAEGRKLASP